MAAHELVLHFCPTTCARVSLVALEETGQPYTLRMVDLPAGEQRSPAYLATNPWGKVPALLVDGALLSETPAILTWLAWTYPESALLPLGRGAFEDARVLAGLGWIASGLHPLTTRMCRAGFFCDVAGGAESVFAMASAAMRPNFALVEQRLAQREWWYGERRSILDVYLAWIWYRVTSTPFDVTAYPQFARLAGQVAALPAAQRAERAGAAGQP